MNGTGLDGPNRRLNATCSQGEALAAEEHHLWSRIGAPDLGDDVVVEVAREVDAADDRAAAPATGSTVTRR